MTNPESTVTWEHFCQIAQLCTAVLADNAYLRERAKLDNEVIGDLVKQRQELYDKLVKTGYSAWAEMEAINDPA